MISSVTEIMSSSPNNDSAPASASEPSLEGTSNTVIQVHISLPSGSTCEFEIPMKEGQRQNKPRHPFDEIEGRPAYKHKLKLLEDNETVHRARADWKEIQSSKVQNEVYTLFGLYFVFQGVVLTALFTASAQSNPHTCGLWLFPFLLCLTASFATIAAVLKKLFNDRQLQEEVGQEKNAMTANQDLATEMRYDWAKFDLYSRPSFGRAPKVISFCSFDFWISYAGAVTLVLVIFSVVVLISCRFILCNRFW